MANILQRIDLGIVGGALFLWKILQSHENWIQEILKHSVKRKLAFLSWSKPVVEEGCWGEDEESEEVRIHNEDKITHSVGVCLFD